MTNTTEVDIVDCPFCPLVAANVNVCNLLVVFKKYHLPRVLAKGQEHLLALSEHFISLARHARFNMKIPIGQQYSIEHDQTDCEVYVERVLEGTYKICFHAKRLN